MPSAASQQQATWLVENGPRELEALLRAIVYHPSTPILIADNDRHSLDASHGAGKLLGLPRHRQRQNAIAKTRAQPKSSFQER